MERGKQTRFASKMKISEAFLSQILNGKKRPGWQTAKRLAAATRTKPDLWMDASPERLKDVLEASNF
ncbi:MAG: helix-turn-helix transcriptional regulator [Patescibacteria group bacterium]|jgi:transcriptional regulator with XRE-family HTH domain